MNEYEIDIIKEGAKAATEVAKDVAQDLVRPSSKSIGNNLGLMIDGVMGWLGCWGEKQKLKQQKYIEEFKQELSSKVTLIPEENLIEPTMSIAGPAIESSKFFYEEKYYRDMFSSLVAASCDKTKIKQTHPAFVEVIKQLSPIDAKLLSMFRHHSTYPLATLQYKDKQNKITPCQQYLFSFKDQNAQFEYGEHLSLTASLDNLIRLGLVIKNKEIVELNFNYDAFKDHFMYKAFDATKEEAEYAIQIQRYRIELTNFGRNFSSICFR